MKKIDLQDFLKNRELKLIEKPKYRNLCTTCMHPEFSCYCHTIEKVDPKIQFVILIHPIEFQRRIATGRMSHLCLNGSHLIRGQDYTNESKVNELIEDSKNQSVILYPGQNSTNLSTLDFDQKRNLFLPEKKLTVFVIDGTWATARQMIRQSVNLQKLPRLCFSPEKPSTFRVRKQPESYCLSTIEAIHQFINLVGDNVGFNTASRQHDRLLKVFDSMVERQIEFVKKFA